MTGNVLINDNANRLSQYYVWSYGPGNESYYKIMYIDFAAAQDKVARQAVILPLFLITMRCFSSCSYSTAVFVSLSGEIGFSHDSAILN